jgi:LuxR family transcriptional regulator, positive regulator of biofilm formation
VEYLHKGKITVVDEMHEDCSVFIFGTANFQNAAFASVLTSELGFHCTCHGDPAEIMEKLKSCMAKAKILMIDCATNDFDAFLADAGSNGSAYREGIVPALYNLEPGMGIEKRAFTRGVRGFFYRQDSLDLMLRGIRALRAGELWMSRNFLMEFALMGGGKTSGAKREKTLLTQRETQILALVSGGAGNEEIAEKLALSPHTVKTHLYNVFKKIKVPNRFQAALWAAKYL